MAIQNLRVRETVNAITQAVDIETHTIINKELERHAHDNEFTDKQYIQYVLTIDTKRNNAKNTILDLHIFAILGVRGGVKTWFISDRTQFREGKGLKKLAQWIRICTL